MAHGPSSTVVRILRDVRSDPSVMQAAADAARGRSIPEDRSLPRHRVQRDVHLLLDAIIAIVQEAPDRERMATHAEALAADLAAQGISLSALLTGVQAARSIVLEGLILRLRDLLTPDDLVTALAALDAEVAPVMTRMVVAHQEAERILARTSTAVRVRALRLLLGTGDPSAAQELGLDSRRGYHCIVADVSAPTETRAVEAAIRTADGVSGLVNGMLCRVTSHLPTTDPGPYLVVTSGLAAIEELPAAHSLCRQSVEVGRRHGHRGLHPVGEYALELAVRAQPLLGRFLMDDLLGGLDPTDPFHRQLAETAHTYLAHGNRVDVTSSILHVHPNTVSHRLRRLAALTRFSHAAEPGEDLAGASRWWWAFDAWLTRAHAARPAGAAPAASRAR
ncbi:MAG TPA: helix-turn-helix domain-containing protein [Kineosporiaceae bacterium]